jgi:hypothetical protein
MIATRYLKFVNFALQSFFQPQPKGYLPTLVWKSRAREWLARAVMPVRTLPAARSGGANQATHFERPA